jgi:carboxymethylenebutenolidase
MIVCDRSVSMSEWVKLRASDGNELSGYMARPEGRARGGIIVVQEIFGVNPSIQGVAEDYAKEGFVAIAPAIFDRFEKDIKLGYGPDDMAKARELMGQLKPESTLADVATAYQFLAKETDAIGVVGFCYGGLTAWLSATRGPSVGMELSCTVGYYAGGIGKVAAEEPSCPVMLHFGADDDHIGRDQRDAVQSAHPEVQICVYDGAGHAFANAARPSFVEPAAKLAWERSLAFLTEHLG